MNNGYDPFKPVKNALTSAWSATTGAFGKLGNALSQTPEAKWFQEKKYGGGALYVPPGADRTNIPGYNFDPYQVGTGDTFETIAARNNMTVQQIQAANNGMLVPPPKGSYINIPKAQQPVTFGGGYVPNAQAQAWLDSRRPATGPGGNTFTSGGSVNVAELVPQLMTQLTAGGLPPIPFPAQQNLINPQTGQPITDQELKDMGYAYDNQTQTWHNGAAAAGGAPAGSVTNAAGTGGADFMNTGFMQRYAQMGTPFLQQKRWDPKSRKFVAIGTLIRQGKLDLKGRWRNGEKLKQKDREVAAVVEATNANTTPGQQLNTNQRGG